MKAQALDVMIRRPEGVKLCSARQLTAEVWAQAVHRQARRNISPEDRQIIMSVVWAFIVHYW